MNTNVPAGNQFRDLLRAKLKQGIVVFWALAKQLDISPASLSMVLNGKCPVTLPFIAKVGKKLKMDEKAIQQYQLNLLVEKATVTKQEFEIIDHDRFALIKDWYHYAILNLMRTKDFKPQPLWISKRLEISLVDAQSAIERLQKVGMLSIQGNVWKDSSSQFTSHGNYKQFSEAAKQNQQQLFEKATVAIDSVAFDNRYHSGSTVALSMDDLTAAREFIIECRKEFIKRFGKKNKADEVYHLSVGLFPLTKIKEK